MKSITPKLMIYTGGYANMPPESQLIVLAHDIRDIYFSGVVVANPQEYSPMGEYSNSWILQNFEDYVGTL